MGICLKKIFNNKKLNSTVFLSFVFLSLFLLFPSGILNSSSKTEQTAEYLTNVVSKYSTYGQYVGMLVQPSETSKKTINDSVSEFRFLYGKFKETNATYISSINAEKTHSVFLKELATTINYSFLNNDHGFGTYEYNGHYKTETYPLELMFSGKHISTKNRQELPDKHNSYTSFIYLPQSAASLLLDKDNLDHTEENYKTLLGKYVILTIDENDYFYWIEDIYLETNYFYNAIYEVMGDFLYCGGYPSNVFKKQALFFLRNYTFQNKYYIDYATTTYSTNDFVYKILTRNLIEGFQLDESKIIIDSNKNDVGSIMIVILSIVFLVCSLGVLLFSNHSLKWYDHLFFGGVLLAPYIIFWFIYKITKNSLLFSSFSTSWEIGLILVFVVTYLLILLLKKTNVINEVKENE